MKPLLLLSFFAALALVGGCGESDAGSAPDVKVNAEQRAQDLNAQATKTVEWLEKLPADQRQGMLDKAPQAAASLKDVTDTTLKSRIDALGVRL